MEVIQVWKDAGKEAVKIEGYLQISTRKAGFCVICKNGQNGEINLDDFNLMLRLEPDIIDEKALELSRLEKS